MYTFKDKLTGALGGVGIAVWYVISILYSIAPLFVLRFPIWVDLILIIVMTAVPFIGEVVRAGLFVWAIFAVFNQPFSIVTIIFLIFAAIYVFTELLPFLFNLWESTKT
jgi:hypothetical protein